MTDKKNELASAMGRRRSPTVVGLPALPSKRANPADLYAPSPDPYNVIGTEAPTAVTVDLADPKKVTPEEVVRSANRSVGKPYPRRVALDLTDQQLRALRSAHVEDGIPITTRVRALVVLWMERPDLAKEAAKLAIVDVEAARQARSNSRQTS